MNGEILYQGHASIRITTKDGRVIYIDPYAGKGYDKPADLILVTHQHFDHNQINKPPHKENCVVWQNFDAQSNGNYITKTFGDIRVEAVEAYNRNHPKEDCVGYLITVDGVKIYVAGDTGLTRQMPELKDENIDYAFLPIDGIFTMTPEEAVECAKIIDAKHVIPYHSNPSGLFSNSLAKRFNIDNKLILQPDETIIY